MFDVVYMIMKAICKKKNFTPKLTIPLLTLKSTLLTEGFSFLYLVLKDIMEITTNRITGTTLIIVPSRTRFPFTVNLVKIRIIIKDIRFDKVVINFINAGF